MRGTTDGRGDGDREHAYTSRASTARPRRCPLDERTFVVDPTDPDNPMVTFGAFDAAGRPQVLYVMLWGLPRRDE